MVALWPLRAVATWRLSVRAMAMFCASQPRPSHIVFPNRLDEYVRCPCFMTTSNGILCGAGANLDEKNSRGNITFNRRYLDPNRVTYEVRRRKRSRLAHPDSRPPPFQYHTGRGNFTFDTLKGKLFTWGLEQLAKQFNLSAEFGVAPQDYTITQYELSFPPHRRLRILTTHLPLARQGAVSVKQLAPHPLRRGDVLLAHREQHARVHPEHHDHQLGLAALRRLLGALHQERPAHRVPLR